METATPQPRNDTAELDGGASTSGAVATRRQLMLRDGLKFLTLTAVAMLLSLVTTLLFRSFESHREELAVRWAARGRQALENGQSKDAVTAFRTSLTYAPDVRDNQLALAQALAASGRVNEAENYFLNLWQARPGDGPINLQLARLERRRGNASLAVDYYRAAIFGTWGGDALTRRRDIRLELSQYMIERGERQAAQAELLVAAGNNPDGVTQLRIAQELEAAKDLKDALAAYNNAAQDEAQKPTAQAKAGELCYSAGDYACASDMLGKALHSKSWTEDQRNHMGTLAANAERLQTLSFAHELPSGPRTEHLMNASHIAQDRLRACVARQASASAVAENSLAALQGRWKDLDSTKNRRSLRRDDDLQDEYAGLIHDTERAVTVTCGPPQGDDALLVYLETHPVTHVGAQAQ